MISGVEPPPAVASEDWSVNPFLHAVVRISTRLGRQWSWMPTRVHVDLHAQSCVLHLGTGPFRIEASEQRGMFHFCVAEELVDGLEYPARMVAVRT